MADKLTFSSMTWDILEEKYGIRCKWNGALFEGCPEVEPSAILTGSLMRGRSFRLANERAKANRLVDPVIAELETLRLGKIWSIPEMDLEVKGVEGLCGIPDFIISASSTYKVVPIVAIVEAKKDDIDAGLPQCAAELYASCLLNKGRPRSMYGCVTTGRDWQFLRYHAADKQVDIDRDTYLISEPAKILGVLCYVVDISLAALGEQAPPLP